MLDLLSRFLHVHSASGPITSPDGRFLAFLANYTGLTQVWEISLGGGWPQPLTFSPDPVRGAWYHSRRPEMVFAVDRGDEQLSLHRLIHEGSSWTIQPLTDSPQATHMFGAFSRDGARIAYTANRDAADRFDVYVQELGETEARRAAVGPGGFFRVADWSPDGRFLLLHQAESCTRERLFLLELDTGIIEPLTTEAALYSSPAWSADGRIYCLSTSGGRDLPAVTVLDLAERRLRYWHTPDAEVDALALSPSGRWLAWTENAGGPSRLWLHDRQHERTHGPVLLPTGVICSFSAPWSPLCFSPDDRKLAFTFEGPRHNLDIWELGLPDAAAPCRLTHSSRAGLDFSQLVEPRRLSYRSFDGLVVPAWYYPPRAGSASVGPPPVVVHVHGGPESEERPTFNPLFQYLTQAGYAVLAPNVRGSSGQGMRYLALDDLEKRLDSVRDLSCAARWLASEGLGDPRRLALHGASYGGFMVLAALVQAPELWAAGIDVVGITHLATFLENTAPYRRSHREAEYGSLHEHRALLDELSPLRQVERIRCPLFVIHGARDPRVPVNEAQQLVAALRQRGVPVEYLRYEDEGHGLARLVNRRDAWPRLVAFLDRHIKGSG